MSKVYVRRSSVDREKLLQLWGDDRSKIFIVISAGWLLSIGVRMAYPLLLPFFRTHFGISLTQAGLLITALWLAYAIGQIPGGAIADRFGEGIALTASMAIASGPIVLVILADSVIALFGGTILLGIAIALFGTVRLTATADVYPNQVGTVHGLIGAIGDIGNTVLPPAVGIVAAYTAWQLGLGMLIPLFAIVAIALWIFVPARTSAHSEHRGLLTRENLRSVFGELRQSSMILGTLFMVIVLAIGQSFIGFFPTYLIEVKEVPVIAANVLFALFFAAGVLIRPLSGNAYDRIGVRTTLLSLTFASAIGLALLPFVDALLPLLIVTALISLRAGQGVIATAYLTVSLSDDVQNTGLGIMRTVIFTAAALSPSLFGALADFGFFDEAFLILAGLSVIALFIVMRLPPVHQSA